MLHLASDVAGKKDSLLHLGKKDALLHLASDVADL